MDQMWEKAREVGRMIAHSDEYKALKRASQQVGDDREAVAKYNQLQALAERIDADAQQGIMPSEQDQEEGSRLEREVMALPVFQAMAAAQHGYERLMLRVNEEIAKGIEAGEQSRIILSS